MQCPRFSCRIKRQKIQRETGGLLALDGRRLVGGHNNQIAVDKSGEGGDGGERRPGWSVWDGAMALVQPSD